MSCDHKDFHKDLIALIVKHNEHHNLCHVCIANVLANLQLRNLIIACDGDIAVLIDQLSQAHTRMILITDTEVMKYRSRREKAHGTL